MDTKKMLKMALIVGASKALKIKRNERMISDEEILQQINRDSEEIISNLGSSH